jgi:murein L,D-transpeptidase YcbB/YkuD
MGRARLVALAAALTVLPAFAGAQGLRGEPSAALAPTWAGTEGLSAVLAALPAMEDDRAWPRLAGLATLRPGDHGEAVLALRARLARSGEAPAAPPGDPLWFDVELEAAVRAFQLRHGLEEDGIVGPATRAELDLSPLDRRRQIERVLAARAALPADLGRRFLLINLPAFELEAVEAGRLGLRARVVVGRPGRCTPTLASVVQTIVANPPWNVPPRIARYELAARIAADPAYVERQGFEVYAAGAPGETLDPATVDWKAFERGEIDLVLRQRPGPLNALGAVSFRFPNPFNVALHDTPEKSLFERPRRAASHGCLRVERAVELARWVAADAPEPTRRALDRALAANVHDEVPLPEPVPIYIVDWPVWIDGDGRLQLRPELPSARPTAAD